MKLLILVLALAQLWMAPEAAADARDTTGLNNLSPISMDGNPFQRDFPDVQEAIACMKLPYNDQRPCPHNVTEVFYAGQYSPKRSFLGHHHYFAVFRLDRIQDCNVTDYASNRPTRAIHVSTFKCDHVWM